MYKQLQTVLRESGLWQQGREATHGFLLSPDVYEIDPLREEELRQIAAALRECLAGIGRIAAIACSPELGRGKTWGMIARALRTGVPSVYHQIMIRNPGSTPAVCKVDFMDTAQGWRIAEIDGHNQHGLGYATLCARMRRAIRPDALSFPGVAAEVAAAAKAAGTATVAFLHGHKDRFYEPESQIFKSELASYGVEMVVLAETQVRIEPDKGAFGPDGRVHRYWLAMPFLQLHEKTAQDMAALYTAGGIQFFIPPKPIFSSKTVLALLRNDAASPELEAILHSQIPVHHLGLLRGYIPPTHLVHKGIPLDHWLGVCCEKSHVLKATVSSGMKGTVFADDAAWDRALQTAADAYYLYVLQEEVENRSYRFSHYDTSGMAIAGEWHIRVVVHFSRRDVAEVTVTARQDKKVHGAIDCIQLGSVLA